jgi:hypothetical protein
MERSTHTSRARSLARYPWSLKDPKTISSRKSGRWSPDGTPDGRATGSHWKTARGASSFAEPEARPLPAGSAGKNSFPRRTGSSPQGRRTIVGGGSPTLEDNAREENITASYASRIVRLTFLAPDIVAAILRDGNRLNHRQQTNGPHPAAPRLARPANRAGVRLSECALQLDRLRPTRLTDLVRLPSTTQSLSVGARRSEAVTGTTTGRGLHRAGGASPFRFTSFLKRTKCHE